MVFGGPPDEDRYCMDWSSLLILAAAIKDTGRVGNPQAQPLLLHTYFINLLWAFKNEELGYLWREKPGDFYRNFNYNQILLLARRKQSEDPRDKAFAIYGIMQESEASCPSPDYRKNVEDVFRDLIIAYINYDKDLPVLFQAPSDRGHLIRNLASWVPDRSDP
ncbi:hypothetical protein LTR72_012198, partial [Exophiala xenobiotica]